MPPKKKLPEPASKKADAKKKEKIIEDKTFGLKNKKGAKNQKYIQQVQNQVKFGNQSTKKQLEQQKPGDKTKKDDKKKQIEELNLLFRPVTAQKIDKGADPKSVLCAFYKQGQCMKGNKCKFSHDLSIERKSEKRNIYVDLRDDADADNMENWDEEKLKEVIEKKHGEAEKKMPLTGIICRYFLDALENNKYGWFWECPNGGDKCHYRHALPTGFVLKKDKKKEDKKDEISFEDLVEKQRAQLGTNLTKITLETFMAWKKKKMKTKEDVLRREEERKKAEFKAGRHVGLSGRDMFTFQPELATEDGIEEGEACFDVHHREDSDDDDDYDNESSEIQNNCMLVTDEFLRQAQEADGTGTVVSTRHWENEINSEIKPDLPEAMGGGGGDEIDAVPIDENLFDEDDDDLEELEEDLENLEVD